MPSLPTAALPRQHWIHTPATIGPFPHPYMHRQPTYPRGRNPHLDINNNPSIFADSLASNMEFHQETLPTLEKLGEIVRNSPLEDRQTIRAVLNEVMETRFQWWQELGTPFSAVLACKNPFGKGDSILFRTAVLNSSHQNFVDLRVARETYEVQLSQARSQDESSNGQTETESSRNNGEALGQSSRAEQKRACEIGDQVEITWSPASSADCPRDGTQGGKMRFLVVSEGGLAGNLSVGVGDLERLERGKSGRGCDCGASGGGDGERAAGICRDIRDNRNPQDTGPARRF
ncbi:hypothetical protein MKZ38_009819 [Zalerion maritima]|uniref:Uncharacterized protein n=1 Tax=Zalerion maritima TaxID=339359 RepID=A0AAD5RZY7_9PEZI|nr:hypothetical protein MKZ38_009819 [Zalerion maritima]